MLTQTLLERLKEICEAMDLINKIGFTIHQIKVRDKADLFDPADLVTALRTNYPQYRVFSDKIANNWIIRTSNPTDPTTFIPVTPIDLPRLRERAALMEEPKLPPETQPQAPIDTSVLEANPMFGMF